MSRLLLTVLFLSATAATVQAEEIDWSAWKALPVLDQGRIKPLDTLADEKATLITGRARWTDPKTGRKYAAPELLYVWITNTKTWLGQPVIRCEYRPLRELLLGKEKREGTFIAVTDFINWEKSQELGKLQFHDPKVQDQFQKFERIDAAERMRERTGRKLTANDPATAETSEERALRKKAGELINHTLTFLTTAEARDIYVVPGLDPRTLTQQFNPDDKTPPWISLGALLRLDNWKLERDVTLAALMAANEGELQQVVQMMSLYQEKELPHLPQLAQALRFQKRLRPALEAIAPALAETKKHYSVDGRGSAEFARAMRIFSGKIADLALAIEDVRPEMGPLPSGAGKPKIAGYKPLALNDAQMALSAYPKTGSLETELYYNRLNPFYVSCWIYGLAVLPLLASWILTALDASSKPLARGLYFVGLCITAAAILFSTWGFILRIVIANRPPVTNMYETVIWVSYVVSVLGLWFGVMPLLSPGLNWAWRLTALPFTWEDSKLSHEDQQKVLADLRIPVGIVAGAARLALGGVMIYYLTQYESTFRVSQLTPPVSGDQTISLNSIATWLVGLGTVLLFSWYLPRAAVALSLSLVTGVVEAMRIGQSKIWEQTYERRLFLVGSIPVALLGMLVAYNVGNMNPQLLNPRIGSIAAVLRNNYWLTIHVLTIVSSYGAGALVWGLGNLAMLYYLFGRYRREELHPEYLSEKHHPAGMKDGVLARLKSAGRGLAPSQIGKTLRAGVAGLGQGDTDLDRARVRPPKDVQVLANFGYKGMQVAVLLLAAGTILGGLWADVSWGRFWDWDPKEVWALISLLVYLIFLHGRFAGWVGTFGTNAGSVLCFQAIMMSWYGVNFVLPKIHGWYNGTGGTTSVGLHSYAGGEGTDGLLVIASACAANLLLVTAAWARYYIETSVPADASPPSADSTTPSEAETVSAS